jgi:hypothetical protein
VRQQRESRGLPKQLVERGAVAALEIDPTPHREPDHWLNVQVG